MKKTKAKPMLKPKRGVDKVYLDFDFQRTEQAHPHTKMRRLFDIERDMSMGIYRVFLTNKYNYLEDASTEFLEMFIDTGARLIDHYATYRVNEAIREQYITGEADLFTNVLRNVVTDWCLEEVYPEQAKYLSRYTPHTDYNYSQNRADTIAMYVGNTIREGALLAIPALIVALEE